MRRFVSFDSCEGDARRRLQELLRRDGQEDQGDAFS